MGWKGLSNPAKLLWILRLHVLFPDAATLLLIPQTTPRADFTGIHQSRDLEVRQGR